MKSIGTQMGGEDAPSLLKLQISGAHMTLVIQSGIKGEMPSFAKKNNAQDTAAIVAYLTDENVCIIHERQHKSFKARASMLVIHGRRLLYDKAYRRSMTFIPARFSGIAIGIIPGRNQY